MFGKSTKDIMSTDTAVSADKDTKYTEKASTRSQEINLIPMDNIAGYDVRPGMYEMNGATVIPGELILQSTAIRPRAANFCSLEGKQVSHSRFYRSQIITR